MAKPPSDRAEALLQSLKDAEAEADLHGWLDGDEVLAEMNTMIDQLEQEASAASTELKRWVDLVNARGHAGILAREHKDKAMVERLIVNDFRMSMEGEFGIILTGIRSADSDPPDCVAQLGNREIGIEVAELVKSEVLEAAAQARTRGDRVTSHDALFNTALWTKDEFAARLSNLLDRKQQRYRHRPEGSIDTLVVCTAEPWLSPRDVEKWLPEIEVQPRSAFRSAYLLMDYVPGYRAHWPVFPLFGHLG